MARSGSRQGGYGGRISVDFQRRARSSRASGYSWTRFEAYGRHAQPASHPELIAGGMDRGSARTMDVPRQAERLKGGARSAHDEALRIHAPSARGITRRSRPIRPIPSLFRRRSLRLRGVEKARQLVRFLVQCWCRKRIVPVVAAQFTGTRTSGGGRCR